MTKTILSVILSLIITFIFAEIFSLYHFGDIPTLRTALYLIALFSIFEYILLSLICVIKRIISKKKIGVKEIIGRILLFIALMMVLGFIVVLDIDWLNWYAYSSPFYINVIIRSLEFLLPALTLIVISIFLLRKKK